MIDNISRFNISHLGSVGRTQKEKVSMLMALVCMCVCLVFVALLVDTKTKERGRIAIMNEADFEEEMRREHLNVIIF